MGSTAFVRVVARFLKVNKVLAGPNPYLEDLKIAVPSQNGNALFFNEHQYAMVFTLSALIIPTDEYPGATEAGVVDYIDTMVVGDKEVQSQYINGLKWIDQASKEKYGNDKNFLALDTVSQVNLLKEIQETDLKRRGGSRHLVGRAYAKVFRYWDNVFGMGAGSEFFKRIRKDVLMAFYANPISWNMVGYYGPPQPVGYLDFADPPSAFNHAPTVKLVNNATCLNCHKEGRHPRGGLIDHTCQTCHRPHAPWLYDEDAFHLEDHMGSFFPSPDRKGKERI